MGLFSFLVSNYDANSKKLAHRAGVIDSVPSNVSCVCFVCNAQSVSVGHHVGKVLTWNTIISL